MASVRQKPKSRFWWACITLPGGKRRQFSTELEDHDLALAAAQEAENAARRFQTKPHNLRAAFTRIAEEIIGQPAVDPATFLQGWAKIRGPEVDPKTAGTYEQVAREAGDWFKLRGIVTLDAIGPDHITSLRDHWGSETSPGTANNKLKILRSAFKYAVTIARHIPQNPAAGVGKLKVGETDIRPFTPQEIELLLPALTGEWRCLFFFGLFTGQRLNDLAELRWKQLDLVNSSMTAIASKTGATIHLPLVSQITDCLADLPSSDDPKAPVFPSLFAISDSSRSNAFRRILASVDLARPIERYKGKKEGPKSKRRQRSELSFHSLRHTATTMLKAAGVADSIARAIIGHESKAVSRVYTHLDLATMRAALDKVAAAEAEPA